ncbi:MAG TPA: DedA family protein [Gemmatimonadaceae bacterium]|nr:DedA family protein [Gemmatimonadaceae bacterium]
MKHEPLIDQIEGSFIVFDPTMPDFAHHLTRLLQSYTYPVLLLLVMLESLGVPLPGEIALVTAAAYASSGHISISIVIALAALGATVGGVLGYWIGIKGGLPLVTRYGGYIGVRQSHVARAHAFFERNGSKTILFGRFVAILRTWAAIVAGAAAMSFTKFVTYNTIGSIVWAIVFGLLGFYFGRDLPVLEKYISRVSLGVLVAAVVGIALFFLLKRSKAGAGTTGDTGASPTIEKTTNLS